MQQSSSKQDRIAQYKALIARLTPKSKVGQGALRAFWVGGAICVLGQVISDPRHSGKDIPADKRWLGKKIDELPAEAAKALTAAKNGQQEVSLDGRQWLASAHTTKGKGVSYMENTYAWHGAAPNREQYEQAMRELRGEAQ